MMTSESSVHAVLLLGHPQYLSSISWAKKAIQTPSITYAFLQLDSGGRSKEGYPLPGKDLSPKLH